MFKCGSCEKEFNSERQLSGHKSIHRIGGRYSKSRKIYTDIHECLNCKVQFEHSFSSRNKFCTRKCSTDYRKNLSNDKIENGEIFSISTMKRYLIEIYGHNCSECGLINLWNNRPLVLQLDHIDGNSDNNAIINLRLLCPNCHSQTETYGSKGNGSRYTKITKRNNYLRKYKNNTPLAQR